MSRACVIGIMGAGEKAISSDIDLAQRLACAVAKAGWVVLCGGRDAGVMAAAAEGAHLGGGLSIGLLPGPDRLHAAPKLTLSLPTGLGHARNSVNVHACDVVVICAAQAGPGTLSELFLSLKAKRPTVVAGLPASLQPAMTKLCPGALFTCDFDETWSQVSGLIRDLADQQTLVPIHHVQDRSSSVDHD